MLRLMLFLLKRTLHELAKTTLSYPKQIQVAPPFNAPPGDFPEVFYGILVEKTLLPHNVLAFNSEITCRFPTRDTKSLFLRKGINQDTHIFLHEKSWPS
jgi:hypothetical protein